MGLADELHPSLQDIEKAAVSDDPSAIPSRFSHIKLVSENAVKEIEAMLQVG